VTRDDEPFMTVDDACRYLGLKDRKAFYNWKFRVKPVCYRLGAGARSLRFKRSDLDAALSKENDRPALAPHLVTTLRRMLR